MDDFTRRALLAGGFSFSIAANGPDAERARPRLRPLKYPHGEVSEIRLCDEDFGIVGDGLTIDDQAFAKALAWLVGNDYRALILPPAKILRIATPHVADFKRHVGCRLIMLGALRPDPGIGDALTVMNTRDSEFDLCVDGGGQTADYTQAAPHGCDQAFVFLGTRQCKLKVRARSYKGRVLRTKREGPGQFKTSMFELEIYTGDTTAGGGRRSGGCGQAFWLEGTTAWGAISRASCMWDDYGSRMYRVDDILFGQMDLTREIVFDSVGSLWGASLAIGDDGKKHDCVQLLNDCRRVYIGSVLAVDGRIGLRIKNTNPVNGSIEFGCVATIGCDFAGVSLEGASSVRLTQESSGDRIACVIDGHSQNIDVTCRSKRSSGHAIVLREGATLIKVEGSAESLRDQRSSRYAAVRCESRGAGIIFTNFLIIGDGWAGGYDLPDDNQVSVYGGSCPSVELFVASPPAVGLYLQADRRLHLLGDLVTGGHGRLTLKANGSLRLASFPSDPNDAEEGDIYFNGTTKKIRCFDGSKWKNIG